MIKKIITVFNTNFSSFKIIIIVAVIWIIFSYFTKGLFLSPRNLSNLFRQVTILVIMSIGLIMVLITGNIDMSVGVITGYTSFFTASMLTVFSTNLPEWYPILNKYISIFGINTTINGLLSTLYYSYILHSSWSSNWFFSGIFNCLFRNSFFNCNLGYFIYFNRINWTCITWRNAANF